MTEFLKLVHGIYPKTEKLRIRIGRWERRVLEAGELESLISEETREFQGNARKLGIDFFTDPLFNWYDIFRPLSVISDGIELGPLTRYGETNTFYRLPEIRGKIATSVDASRYKEIGDNPPLPLFHVDQKEDTLGFLPGPETFYHFCGNLRNLSFKDFSFELGNYYNSLLSKFKFNRIFIFESVPLKSQELQTFYSVVRPDKVFLFTVGTLNAKTFDRLGKFHSILTNTADSNIDVAKAHSSIPGISVIDAHNTKVESVSELNGLLSAIAKKHGLEKAVITHTDYLDFLPREIADKKIAVLGKVGE